MNPSTHTFFIVSAYGMVALAIAIELWATARRRSAALRRARELPEED
ncbi:MAG: heme exporter protein CcmD [Burkholderiaceae bacterium]